MRGGQYPSGQWTRVGEETDPGADEITTRPYEAGCRQAALLAGFWDERTRVPALSSIEVEAALAALAASAAASVAWWRIRKTGLANLDAAQPLRQSYRLQALRAAFNHQQLAAILGAFERHAVPAVLVKGPVIAALYPEIGLRPYGDLDFYVPASCEPRAWEALAELPDRRLGVEIKTAHSFPSDQPAAELIQRAQRIEIGGLPVLVPTPEDHLRLLCLHFVCHGGWRPLWLCDIALFLARLPDAFDWDYFLRGNPLHLGWIRATLRLACDVLGAPEAAVPERASLTTLPSWLTPALYRQWGSGTGQSALGPLGRDAFSLRRTPRALAAEMRDRWSNPIQASVALGVPFNDLPRLPFQAADTLRRAANRFTARSRPTAKSGSA